MMMNLSVMIALALNCLLLSAGNVWSADPTSPVQGTWQLVSYQTTRSDGTTTDLYGPNPLGVLIYDASGHMSVHLLKRNLRQCGTIDRRKCPDAEARLAFDNYAGYWGRYEVNWAERVVVHHVEGASWPDYIGTSQKRFIDISEDILTITTPTLKIGGVDSVGVLVWKRME